jgi:hypothetical protein
VTWLQRKGERIRRRKCREEARQLIEVVSSWLIEEVEVDDSEACRRGGRAGSIKRSKLMILRRAEEGVELAQ